MAWDAVHQRTLALICSVYASIWSTRPGFSLALLEMTKDKSMNIDNNVVARLNASGQLAYALGKCFGGAGVDALGGRKALIVVLMTMSACFGRLARSKSASASMVAAVALSRFVHAASWPATTLVIRSWFANNGQALAVTLGGASSRIGMSLGSVISGLLLAKTGNWRVVLGSASAATGLAAATSILRLTPKEIGSATGTGQPIANKQQVVKAKKMSTVDIVKAALRSERLMCLYGSATMLTLTFELGTLLPQFLSEEYGMDSVGIGSVSGAFPIASPPAIVLGGMALSKLAPASKPAFLLATEGAAALGFLVLAQKPSRAAVVPALVSIMAGISPAFYCLPADWILRWAGPYAGTFSSLSDVPGNLFSTLVYLFIPRMLKRGGWASVMRFYAIQVAISGLCMARFQMLEARDPTTKSPFVEEVEDAAAA
eukprot:TRINITY_DN37979_c0_g1_i1.p1 TRINITY_DN37979_c0_g1~~TRINITY_DN37979_c0_g1_i1.p1  ORF type:complete len:430 (-),score=84.59 TRINITY_DN37979_c0_g1_i1:380-1669(-)